MDPAGEKATRLLGDLLLGDIDRGRCDPASIIEAGRMLYEADATGARSYSPLWADRPGVLGVLVDFLERRRSGPVSPGMVVGMKMAAEEIGACALAPWVDEQGENSRIWGLQPAERAIFAALKEGTGGNSLEELEVLATAAVERREKAQVEQASASTARETPGRSAPLPRSAGR